MLEPDAAPISQDASTPAPVAADPGYISSPFDSDDGPMPSEAAEAAAISDARDRGETIIAAALANEPEEDTDKKATPSMDQMLGKLPAEIKDALEDLFRARWTRVIRVRKKDLA